MLKWHQILHYTFDIEEIHDSKPAAKVYEYLKEIHLIAIL